MADVAKIQASVVGGPTAAAEYAAQQGAVGGLKQQALTDAGNRADFAQAPAAFQAAQQARLAQPLDAQIAELGSQSSAAGQYSGALNSANSAYMAAVNSATPLIAAELRKKAEGLTPFDGYEADYTSKLQEMFDKKQAQIDKQKKQQDAQNKDFKTSQKEFARQDAANDSSLGHGSYGIIDDVLKHSDDLPTADRYLQMHYTVDPKTGSVTYADGPNEGNTVDGADAAAITNYITKALQEQQQPNATTHYKSDGTVASSSGSVLTGDDAAAFKALYGTGAS